MSSRSAVDRILDGDRAYSDCPDDDVFRKLASVYVAHHPQLRDNNFCEDSPTFPGGITNGADWYPVRGNTCTVLTPAWDPTEEEIAGGMQDYNYIHGGALELTLEVSCCKYPIASELRYFWELNRESMLQLLMQVNSGMLINPTPV